MMFALLQEQRKLQMDTMAVANQRTMEAMFKRMNAIVGGHGKAVDKENTPPMSGNTGSSTGGTKRNCKKCSHCGKHVFHKAADCYALEANASKRWTGWKSVKDTREASA
jgi:hypothetical protein